MKTSNLRNREIVCQHFSSTVMCFESLYNFDDFSLSRCRHSHIISLARVSRYVWIIVKFEYLSVSEIYKKNEIDRIFHSQTHEAKSQKIAAVNSQQSRESQKQKIV